METPTTIKALLDRYLMPYQAEWLADDSRYKIGMWSRQTGKSFATACEAVVDCVFLRPGQHWVVLSAGERQALEWMRKAQFWVEAFRKIINFAAPKYTELLNAADARLSKSEVQFANGSRITAIPANPDTARGYSCNVILDEFAIHENPGEIWAAIFPSVTSPHGGLKKLRIVSTPKGRGNKFADLWEHNENYSTHKVTIEDAVRMGLKVNIDELKAGVDDPDIWAQEYMCEFIDSTSVLLPYEMIGKCESENIKDDNASPLYIGMDVGRSKDLSVIVTAAKLGDVLSVLAPQLAVQRPARRAARQGARPARAAHLHRQHRHRRDARGGSRAQGRREVRGRAVHGGVERRDVRPHAAEVRGAVHPDSGLARPARRSPRRAARGLDRRQRHLLRAAQRRRPLRPRRRARALHPRGQCGGRVDLRAGCGRTRFRRGRVARDARRLHI